MFPLRFIEYFYDCGFYINDTVTITPTIKHLAQPEMILRLLGLGGPWLPKKKIYRRRERLYCFVLECKMKPRPPGGFKLIDRVLCIVQCWRLTNDKLSPKQLKLY